MPSDTSAIPRARLLLAAVVAGTILGAMLAHESSAQQQPTVDVAPDQTEPQPPAADDAPPTLDYPLSAAVDAAGAIYLADRNLPGVWKIADGTLSLYFRGEKKFRTPLNAVRCLAIDPNGNLLAGDTATRQVFRFDAEGKPMPLVSGLGIGQPMAIAVRPSGELLVADLELHCIWKVPAEGGEASRLAEVPAPRGLWLDSEERLWVVSGAEQPLVRVLPDGTVEPIIEDRAFEFPHNVVLDPAGNAYVSDGYAKAIWKIPPGRKPEKWVSEAPLVNPVGLAWRGEALLVVDPRARGVFQIDPQGKLTPLEFKPAGT